jgi:hypothetical protein
LAPNPATAAKFEGAIFRSVRDQKNRLTVSQLNGQPILMDDNVTARWALLWSHGVPATHHLRGWTFAHVWAEPKNPDAYTRLANLCMMPEYFGSLSDKEGPLCAFLKYHAWECYGWHPASTRPPSKPDGYDTVEWRYLPAIADPRSFIRQRMNALDNQRVRLLRELMPEFAV